MRRSVVAAQHLTVARAVARPVMVSVVRAVAPMWAIAVPGADAAFPIGGIRREVARAGIARDLIDIIILRPCHRSGMILLHRIWQPLIAPAATAGVAASIS